MRIAVWHNLPSGGAKRALYDHVSGLVKRGHSVEVWCSSTADLTYLPLGELVTEHVVPFQWRERFYPSRIRRLFAAYTDHVQWIQALQAHWQQTAKEINRGGFDLLFANSCRLFAVPGIARYLQLPSVLYLQEPFRVLYEAMPQLPWVARDPLSSWHDWNAVEPALRDLLRTQALRVQAREELYNARAFDRILVNSHFSRENIFRVYRLEARVCYLGINTELFKPTRQPRENFVLGVGTYYPHKNIAFVLRALAQIQPPRPELVWIGNDQSPYLNETRQLADSLGVAYRPLLRVGDTELVDFYNRAAMLVYAPTLEPFGYAPLEANACETPVVAVAEGGVRETVIDGINGLVTDRAENEFAAAIMRLVDNPELASKLGENGRETVLKRWSLEAATSRLEKAILEQIPYSVKGIVGAMPCACPSDGRPQAIAPTPIPSIN